MIVKITKRKSNCIVCLPIIMSYKVREEKRRERESRERREKNIMYMYAACICKTLRK